MSFYLSIIADWFAAKIAVYTCIWTTCDCVIQKKIDTSYEGFVFMFHSMVYAKSLISKLFLFLPLPSGCSHCDTNECSNHIQLWKICGAVSDRAVESESRSRSRMDFEPEESESQKILATPTPGWSFICQLWLFVPPVAYAENSHGGGFIQLYMVVICIWSPLFVTSQFDVMFMFPNQCFGEVFWHNMKFLLHALPYIYTSQFDVIFMFPNQRFGDVFWHNMLILLHALPLIYVSLNSIWTIIAPG